MPETKSLRCPIPKIRLLLLLALILIFSGKTNAKTDSLKQIWTDTTLHDSIRFDAIERFYQTQLFSQPDSAILLTAYHINLAKQKQSTRERAKALNRKGIAYSIKGDYDKALMEMNAAIELYSRTNDSIALINVYNNIANIHSYTFQYQEALNLFSKCLAYYQENGVDDHVAGVLMNIGLIHLDISNHEMAIDYFNQSLQLYEKLGTENKVGNIWSSIAEANLEKKNFLEALKNNRKSLNVFSSHNHKQGIATCYIQFTKIYKEMNQVDSALFYLEKGLNMHQTIGADLSILEDKILLAQLTLPTDVNKAIKIGEEALLTARNYNDHSMKSDLYNLLYKCYRKKKNYPHSLSMLEQYNIHSDSLRLEQDHIAFTQKAIQSEYETKLLDSQLQNEKKQSQLKLTQLRNNYTILLIGLIVVLCIIFHYRAKKILLDKQKEVLLNQINHLNELRNTRHQLFHSEKMASLGQLTAGIAHEINNPVNFISSGIIGLKKSLKKYIEFSQNGSTDEIVKDMNDMISAIEEGASRTSTIVKSLQLFSREDTENYIEADVITGLESTYKLLSHRLEPSIILVKAYELKEVKIFCFPGQLNQVFMNILLNAVQASKGAGTIKVGVKKQKENVVISISDDGPGIPDDKKEKIFEPFYTTKNLQEGTGLGLSITFGIIKKHKGSIEVKDNEPKGTKFIIKLPIREESLISK